MQFYRIFRTFQNFAKCKALGDFLISLLEIVHPKGFLCGYQPKFEFLELIWDSRYFPTLALKQSCDLLSVCSINSAIVTISDDYLFTIPQTQFQVAAESDDSTVITRQVFCAFFDISPVQLTKFLFLSGSKRPCKDLIIKLL